MHCLPHLCYMTEVCDLTNEIDILHSHVGLVYESVHCDSLKADLNIILGLTSSVMGCLRREKSFSDKDLETIMIISRKYAEISKSKSTRVFYPPIGSESISRLSICRAMSKKISRMYLKLYFKGINKCKNTMEFLGHLSNIFYCMGISIRYD